MKDECNKCIILPAARLSFLSVPQRALQPSGPRDRERSKGVEEEVTGTGSKRNRSQSGILSDLDVDVDVDVSDDNGSVNQKDSVEINLIEEVEKEEDSFECLINEVSYQNLRNHSLKTREKTLAEWREYKEESCVVRKIIKDLGGPFQYRAIKEAHFPTIVKLAFKYLPV